MENCEKAIEKATKEGNYKPRLSLFVQVTDDNGKPKGTKPTGSHRVTLVGDRVVKGTDYRTGEEIYMIELTVNENGIDKTYTFPMKDKKDPKKPHYLVDRFASLKAGTEVILTGKKGANSSYVDVEVVGGETDAVDVDDIPIINDEDDGNLPENTEEIPY